MTTNNIINTIITSTISIAVYMLLPTTSVDVATTPRTAEDLCGGVLYPHG